MHQDFFLQLYSFMKNKTAGSISTCADEKTQKPLNSIQQHFGENKCRYKTYNSIPKNTKPPVTHIIAFRKK